MGIYIFNRNVLIECLNNDLFDFGKHVIPAAIQTRNVSAYIFDGYWKISERFAPFTKPISISPT